MVPEALSLVILHDLSPLMIAIYNTPDLLSDVYLCVEVYFDELPESTGVVVPHRLCVSKCLQQRISWKDRNK